MKKKSKLYSVLHETCPRCHEGKVFKYPSAYQSLSFGKLNDHCSVCGQSFDPEPGFYQGAMYVSYAFTLGLSFAIGLVMTLLFDANVWQIGLVLSLVLIILLPPVFRISRMVWLNMFVDYHPVDTQPNTPNKME
ncbi:MAG: DUF983 domain-containing protein [Bacteroidota bacterium]